MLLIKGRGKIAIVGGISFLLWLFFMPTYVVSWLSNLLSDGLFKLNGKRTEYRADCHAYTLGYGDGLVSYLEKLSQMVEHDNSFFANLFAKQPAPMKRLGKLEEYFRNNVQDIYQIRVIDKFFPTFLIVLFLGSMILYDEYRGGKYKEHMVNNNKPWMQQNNK